MSGPRIVLACQVSPPREVEAQLRARLLELRRRGVDVRLVLPSSGAAQSLLADLADYIEVASDTTTWLDAIRASAPDWLIGIDSPLLLASLSPYLPTLRQAYEVQTTYPEALAPLLDPRTLSGVSGIIVPTSAHADWVRDLIPEPRPVAVVPAVFPDGVLRPELVNAATPRGLITPAQSVDQLLSVLRLWSTTGGGAPATEPSAPADLAELDASIKALRRQLVITSDVLYRRVLDRDQAIQALQSELHDKVGEANSQIQTLQTELQAKVNERDELIRTLQADVAGLGEQLIVRDQHVRRLEAQVEEKERTIGVLAGQIQLYEQIEAVQASGFWKVGRTFWTLIGGILAAVRLLIPLRLRRWLYRYVSEDSRRAARQRMRAWRQLIHHPALVTDATPPEAALLPEGQGLDVMCFPVINWDFRFQRPQQLATQFARHGHRIFYLSERFIGLERETCTVRPLDERIYELGLPGDINTLIHTHRLDGATLNQAQHGLDAFIQAQAIAEVVCLVQHPFWAPLARSLRQRYGWKIVYDCMDDHAGFGTRSPAVLEDEPSLLRESDLVVASSTLLYEKATGFNAHCVLIPNAGDYAHFSVLPPRDRSPIAQLARPVIGYYGAIAEWFDVAAVRHAASQHPDWSFVLIGHTFGSQLGDLVQRPNVHIVEETPYSRLPAYLAGFDVCVIPFVLTPLTLATHPVKVFEYLSAGKPVVAAALPELQPFADVVYQYTEPAQFSALLERALAEDGPSRMAQRQAVARQNTWVARYQIFEASTVALYGKVSIIIVSYNGLEHTQRCLESILTQTNYPHFELIIVDNASDQPVRDYLSGLTRTEPRVRVIFNATNVGFAAANNIGLAAATDGEFLVLLNNDTVVPPDWLSRLLRYARQPDIGLVGPVTNWTGNEARIDVDYTHLSQMPSFARRWAAAHAGEHFDIRVLAMYCLAMRREVFEQVGPLDERFGMGMFEDDDYAQRIRAAGYRVVCAEDAFVHHHGMASFGKLDQAEYTMLFERNRRLYEEKWRERWLPHAERKQVS